MTDGVLVSLELATFLILIRPYSTEGRLLEYFTADSNPKAIRAGIPDKILSGSVIYDFQNGVSGFASVTDVTSVYSGYSQAVKLPAYTLVNAGDQIRHW